LSAPLSILAGDVDLEEWNTFLTQTQAAKGTSGVSWLRSLLHTLTRNLDKLAAAEA
jgi:hypothetical protein